MATASYSYKVSVVTSCPPYWQASHAYALGAVVFSAGQTYTCTTAGTSSASAGPSAPSGTGIVDGSAVWSWTTPGEATQVLLTLPKPATWTASTAYLVNDLVTNGANIYKCKTAGTSAASGGPTGTGNNITDGTAVWTQSAAVLSARIVGVRIYAPVFQPFSSPIILRRWPFLFATNGGAQVTTSVTDKVKGWRADSSSVGVQTKCETSTAWTFVQPTSGIGYDAVLSNGGDPPGAALLPTGGIVINPGECVALITGPGFAGTEPLTLQIDITEG